MIFWEHSLGNTVVELTFLGINGFRFSHMGYNLLIDPFSSRTSASEPVSNPKKVHKYSNKANTIFLTHSHWDHSADIPEIAAITGAAIYGSQTTCNILKYFEVEESLLHEFSSHTTYTCGPFNIRPIPSLHKSPCLYPGVYSEIPERVSLRSDYLEGGTWAFKITCNTTTFLILGSANYIPSEMKGEDCDYLLVSIAGREPHFMSSLLGDITTKNCIPTHFDYFDTPMEHPGMRVSVDEFRKEVASIDPNLVVHQPVHLRTMKIR